MGRCGNEIPVCGEAIARHVAVQIAPEYAIFVKRQLADGRAELFDIEARVGTAHRIKGPDSRAVTCPQRFVPLQQLEMPTKVARAPLLLADAEHMGDECAGTATSGDGNSS